MVIGKNPYVKGIAETEGKTSGKVYMLICNMDEIPEMQKKYCVSSISCDEESGKATLRIIGEKVPPPGAVAVKPILGDFKRGFQKM